MAKMTTATALRQLQAARANLRKARQALRLLKAQSSTTSPSPEMLNTTLRQGWLTQGHVLRLLAEIPLEATDDAVMVKMISVQRYATAFLVRLRRLSRGDLELGEVDDLGDEWESDAEADNEPAG